MRNKKIDILKGLGIIFVVWGHATKIFSGYIYTFHMPLFFWISGFLRFGGKEKPWKEFIKGKIKTALIPYIVFWFISVIIFNNLYYIINFHHLAPFGINQLKGLILGGKWLATYSNNFPLWYLQLYFIASITFEFIIRKCNKIEQILLFTYFIIITIPLQNAIPGRPIFHINVLPPALIFMLMGYHMNYLFQKNKFFSQINKNTLIGILLLIIGWRLSIIYYGNISDIKSILYLIGSSFTIIGLYIIVDKLINYKPLLYIGNKTLYILGLHALTFNTTRKLAFFILNNVGINNTFITAILVVSSSIIICCALTECYTIIKITISKNLNNKKIYNN